MKERIITCTLCIISCSLLCFQPNYFFFFSLSPSLLASLWIIMPFLMHFIPAANYGTNGIYSKSRLVFLPRRDFPPLCVPYVFSAPPSWQMSFDAQVVVKLSLFSRRNPTRLSRLLICMCSDETGCAVRFEVGSSRWDRCCVEEGSERRVRESFFSFWHLSKMKGALSVLLMQR